MLSNCAFLAVDSVGKDAQGRKYKRAVDAAPLMPLNQAYLRDALPREEPITAAGNKSPYVVNGRTYHVLDSTQGYSERGIASWYGAKFHGRKTSNGERYSLYAMTAAHKSLPIPSYVRVTNVDNGRSTIVRVNDRGPFKHGRVIDLSYAAATKLGFADKGTAQVEVVAIDVRQHLDELAKAEQAAANPALGDGDEHFLQAGAFRSYALALDLKEQLQHQLKQAVSIKALGDWYRVHIGPVGEAQLKTLQGDLVALGLGITPVKVTLPVSPSSNAGLEEK